jgi:cell division septation protein DedD
MKNKDDAEFLAQKISKKGFPAYSVSGVSEDSVLWHRVRVGKYDDRKSAENMRHKLLEDLKINGIVLTIK